MTTIPSRMLLFKPIIKKPIVINHTFFTTNTFSKMNSFAYNNAIVIQQLYDQIYMSQQDCYKDNLSFGCLQLFKHKCLNLLASNESTEMTVKDLHSSPSFGTCNPSKLVNWITVFFFWFSYVYHHRLVK